MITIWILQQLSNTLITRGYNICLINRLFSKLRSLSRDDLLQPHSQVSGDKLSFIIPFNLDTARIGQILHEHWHFIQEGEDLCDIASTIPIVAFNRNTNIKDLLIHTKFTSPYTGYNSLILYIMMYSIMASFSILLYRTPCPYYNA